MDYFSAFKLNNQCFKNTYFIIPAYLALQKITRRHIIEFQKKVYSSYIQVFCKLNSKKVTQRTLYQKDNTRKIQRKSIETIAIKVNENMEICTHDTSE